MHFTLRFGKYLLQKTQDYKSIVKNVDVIFDTLGDKYTVDAFEVIKERGKVVSVIGALDEETAKMFGMSDYELPAELADAIKSKNASYKYIWMHPSGSDLNEIKTLIEAEKIKPVVDKIYPFSGVKEAFLHLASGRAKGKIIVKIK